MPPRKAKEAYLAVLAQYSLATMLILASLLDAALPLDPEEDLDEEEETQEQIREEAEEVVLILVMARMIFLEVMGGVE